MAAKGPEAFRTISEAAAELGVAAHVLRFWETRFSFVRPMTRSGGRRFYRPQDLEVLRGVRALLRDQGCSIKEVQRLQREEGTGRLIAAGVAAGAGPGSRAAPRGAESHPPTAGHLASPERRPALAQAARSALGDVLADLERTKGRIDRLLAAGAAQS